MPQLNSRQAELLLILLKTHQPASANGLAHRLGITARMVRYNLLPVRSWLAEREVELVMKPRMGILVQASEAARTRLIREFQQQPTPLLLFRSDDRLNLLLFELFSSGEYITNEALKSNLSISRTTLARDLNRAEKWLLNHHLFLRRKPGLGVMIVGREDDYRHLLTSLILQVCPEMALIDLFSWGKRVQDIDGVNPGTVQATIMSRISVWESSTAWRYMSQIEEALEVPLVDRDHLSLSLYFSIMVRRIRQGQVIDHPVENNNDQFLLSRLPLLRSISDRYHRETGMRIPDAELVHLSLQTTTSLRQSREYKALSEPADSKQKEVPPELIRQFVNAICHEIDGDLAHPEVIERMIQHLNRSVTRLKHGLPIRNPLTDQVQKEFPALWKVTAEAVRNFEKMLDLILPVEEISFLTMYMGLAFEFPQKVQSKRRPRVIVACPSGGVTVWMLVSRLQAVIPEIEIVDVVSMRELNAMKLEAVDAVISTASFTLRKLPVITVSPFVDSQEVDLVRQCLKTTP